MKSLQKQPSRGFISCSENMQQIYGITTMPKYYFNKGASFSEHLFLRTPLGAASVTTVQGRVYSVWRDSAYYWRVHPIYIILWFGMGFRRDIPELCLIFSTTIDLVLKTHGFRLQDFYQPYIDTLKELRRVRTT